MEALRLIEVNKLVFEQDASIPRLGADEVLVKVMAAGVCGSDYGRVFSLGAHTLPIILGHEFSGLVEAVGPEVREDLAGRRIVVTPLIPCRTCEWCRRGEYSLCDAYGFIGSRRDGAFEQYVAVPASALQVIPDTMTYAEAAVVEPTACMLHAMYRGPSIMGRTVCISGAGPIGLLGVQYAKASGASEVVCVDIIEKKLELARRLGADKTVNLSESDLVPAGLSATDGRGFDFTFETTGNPNVQNGVIQTSAKLGSVVYFGFSGNGLTLNDESLDRILRAEVTLTGAWNSYSTGFPGREWQTAIDMIADHRIDVSAVVSHILPLEEAPSFFEKVRTHQIEHGKVLFAPWGIEGAQL
ncbi:galactitol-1-phosphate 5-dehydrogenase [Schaalia naturae]|uniref:Galactitol-1-phosphate 5-dehydrogenase n=1 Tax=Schaalia naturae TaxID=635203 RepID=A0ABW2SJQ6_9ACTO